jgi:hypothetical protein
MATGSRGNAAGVHRRRPRDRAHALMFLDLVDEARALYLKYRGQQNVFGNKSWETGILEGFAELQKAGLTHPLMHEIEKQFAGT